MAESGKEKPKNAETSPKKRRLALSEQVLIALALGIAAGIFFGELAGVLKVVGDIFIMLLQITVIPYISLSLITGLGELSVDAVKRLALKGGSILVLIWAMAIILVLLIPFSFPAWPSASFFSTSLIEKTTAPDFLRLFIPANPFYSYANSIVPAVVVFSVLVGVALIGRKNKHAVIEPLSVLREALITMTGMISKLAPYGVFALIANTVGTIAMEDLARLQVFIVLYALNALVFSLWVLPALVAALTPLRYADVSRALRTPLVTAFATGSSLIVVPMLIEQCKQLIAEGKALKSESREMREYADSSVEVLIPTVYPFPSAGVVLTLSFILFAGWYIGSDVSPAAYLTLISAGIPSLFAGTLTSMPFLLDLVKLPRDLFQVYVSLDVITVRFVTLVAATHYATIGLIGTMAMVGKLRFRWFGLLRFALISSVLVAVVLAGVRGFYTYVVVAPYTKADALRSLDFQGLPQPATVYTEIPTELVRISGKPASFDEILERGVLRVCYQPNEYPSAFYNNASPPQLVGFDVEVAHRLARGRQLTIEFLPARHENEAAERLNTGVCDIYMRTLPLTAGRTRKFAMTEPVYRSALGLVVRDHRRDEFREWDALREAGDSLRIGLDASSESISVMQDILPDATTLPIEDMVEQNAILESGAEGVDAIADMAEEGAAWTLLYPSFSLVVPQPTVFTPVTYAVAAGNRDLLEAFNAWLVAENAKGTIDALYDYWMLGGAIETDRPPRWSVIRDVLGWVD